MRSVRERQSKMAERLACDCRHEPERSLPNFDQFLVFCDFMAVRKVVGAFDHYNLRHTVVKKVILARKDNFVQNHVVLPDAGKMKVTRNGKSRMLTTSLPMMQWTRDKPTWLRLLTSSGAGKKPGNRDHSSRTSFPNAIENSVCLPLYFLSHRGLCLDCDPSCRLFVSAVTFPVGVRNVNSIKAVSRGLFCHLMEAASGN